MFAENQSSIDQIIKGAQLEIEIQMKIRKNQTKAKQHEVTIHRMERRKDEMMKKRQTFY